MRDYKNQDLMADKKMKECPSCAMNIEADNKVCPVCQYEFPKESMAIKIVALLLLILMVLFFIL